MSEVVKKGVVRWFDKRLGYGFITGPNGEDVFVHYEAIPGKPGKRNLEDGDQVTYVESQREQGVYASRITEVVRPVVVIQGGQA